MPSRMTSSRTVLLQVSQLRSERDGGARAQQQLVALAHHARAVERAGRHVATRRQRQRDEGSGRQHHDLQREAYPPRSSAVNLLYIYSKLLRVQGK